MQETTRAAEEEDTHITIISLRCLLFRVPYVHVRGYKLFAKRELYIRHNMQTLFLGSAGSLLLSMLLIVAPIADALREHSSSLQPNLESARTGACRTATGFMASKLVGKSEG